MLFIVYLIQFIVLPKIFHLLKFSFVVPQIPRLGKQNLKVF